MFNSSVDRCLAKARRQSKPATTTDNNGQTPMTYGLQPADLWRHKLATFGSQRNRAAIRANAHKRTKTTEREYTATHTKTPPSSCSPLGRRRHRCRRVVSKTANKFAQFARMNMNTQNRTQPTEYTQKRWRCIGRPTHHNTTCRSSWWRLVAADITAFVTAHTNTYA